MTLLRLTVPAETAAELYGRGHVCLDGPGKHSVSYWIRGGDLLNFVGAVETPIAHEGMDSKFPWED